MRSYGSLPRMRARESAAELLDAAPDDDLAVLPARPAVVVVVPCYNEARRLEPDRVLELLRRRGVDVLFVDDGSTDATGSILESVCATAGSRATALALRRNEGKAEAVRRGLQQAVEAGAQFVAYLDADLSTPVEEMLRLIDVAQQAGAVDVVLGARVALLGATIERKRWRHYVGRVFATAASVILGLPVYDTQCGAKVFRATEALRRALATPFAARWAFDVELIGRLLVAGGAESRRRFVEVPLREWCDVRGSKLSVLDAPRIALELLRTWWALRRQR
jgi:dolichyl-phosphate beta-glucosyltransferase